MKIKLFFLFKSLFFLSHLSYGQQDSLMNLLDEAPGKIKKEPVTAAFFGTRVVNGQSVENPGKGILQFDIGHRFDAFHSSGDNIFYNFFGLDGATIRIGFDYGINDKLTAGIGRSSLQKTYDGYLKHKLLRQAPGMPVTVVIYSDIAVRTDNKSDANRTIKFIHRLAYSNQLLIARKFNKNLSLQLSPTYIHRNVVTSPRDQNDVFAIGFGGRYKIFKRVSINAEYFYLLPGYTADNFSNSFSFGVDLETGGHVFQLNFTNSAGLIESQFIPMTSGNWMDMLRFGFNVSRVFSIARKN